jgi:exosome complex protein LRP1
VKQYFQKIKQAEDGQNPMRPTLSLNKQATGRFIKQALAGNDRYDTERAEREAREKLLAARKSRIISSAGPEPLPQNETSTSSEQNEEMEDGEVDRDDSETIDTLTEDPHSGKSHSQKKKEKKREDRLRMNGQGIVKSKKGKKGGSRKEDHTRAGFQGNLEQELVKPG